MSARPFDERVAEIRARREKTKKKLEQYDEQIKRLERQDAEEKRRKRTHSLVVCGAELASLFGKVLEQDEIYAVVNFLREQQEAGIFSLEKTKTESTEETQEQETEVTELFGDLFHL